MTTTRIQPMKQSFLASTTTKFRELNADKVLYNVQGHTVELPRTLTVTSEIPTPTKGNPGALKTQLNLRLTDVLDKGTDLERKVPCIAKVEFSIPIGSSQTVRDELMTSLMAFAQCAIPSIPGEISPDDLTPEFKLVYQSLLPA